jgi:hypothetical protein
MANRILTLLLALVVALAPSLVFAAGTYTGTAPVPTQSDQDRATALRAAMSQAVVQAAKGDASVLKRPEVARALTRAERYARGYSYQPNDTANNDPRKAPVKFLLVAQFDSAQIDALVRSQTAAALAPDAAAGQPSPPNGAATPGAAPGAGATVAPAANATAGGAAATVPASTSTVPASTSADSSNANAADAATSGAPGTYRIWFSGLRSADDYARIVGALNGNPEVRTVRVEQAHGNVLETRIDARGSLQSLTASLDAAHVARQAGTASPTEGVDAVLDFQP